MGSIIRNPNPYPWDDWNPSRRPNRAYYVAVRQENSEVVCLIESDVLTGENIYLLSEKLGNRFFELIKQYPLPDYDILMISVPGIEELRAMLNPVDDFAGVQIEKVTAA